MWHQVHSFPKPSDQLFQPGTLLAQRLAEKELVIRPKRQTASVKNIPAEFSHGELLQQTSRYDSTVRLARVRPQVVKKAVAD